MQTFRYLLVVALMAVTAFALIGYRADNRGKLLYQEYFDATPTEGYAQIRAFGAASDTDVSIFRQAVLYHQQGDYDLALVALRAYLAGNATTTDASPFLLAATAAMATGEYAEAEQYLGALPQNEASRLWYEALLELYEEDFEAATGRLSQLTTSTYPARELLVKL